MVNVPSFSAYKRAKNVDVILFTMLRCAQEVIDIKALVMIVKSSRSGLGSALFDSRLAEPCTRRWLFRARKSGNEEGSLANQLAPFGVAYVLHVTGVSLMDTLRKQGRHANQRSALSQRRLPHVSGTIARRLQRRPPHAVDGPPGQRMAIHMQLSCLRRSIGQRVVHESAFG